MKMLITAPKYLAAAGHGSADTYYFWNQLGAWILIAAVCWLVGLFFGWLLWRNHRREVAQIEAGNRELRSRVESPASL